MVSNANGTKECPIDTSKTSNSRLVTASWEAIIRALKCWRTDLIGTPFLIYTDHKTLENFEKQRDLSHRQVRWMEFLSQYDGKIVYVKGEDNTVADALSRLPGLTTTSQSSSTADQATHPIFHITSVGTPVASVLDMPRASPIMITSTLASLSHKEMKPSKLVIATDNQFLLEIKEAYKTDPFVKFLSQAEPGMPTVKTMNGFWFIGE